MVQSPSWAANWFAVTQEIPRISRNPKVHYRTHKRTPPVSILGQPNPVHMPTSHLLEIYPNIIRPSTPRSPQWSLSLRFPHQDPIYPSLLTHTLTKVLHNENTAKKFETFCCQMQSTDSPSIDCNIAVTASYCLLQLSGPLLYVSPRICVRKTHTHTHDQLQTVSYYRQPAHSTFKYIYTLYRL